MNKWQKRIVGWVVVTFILAATIWFTWLPILTSLMVKGGDSFFRKHFPPGQKGYICIHEDEWATSFFAGTKGLPVIKKLSQDPSLAQCGSKLAGNLYLHISTGGHLTYVRERFTDESTTWIGRQYYRYLLRNDSDYLKQRGMPIPEGEH